MLFAHFMHLQLFVCSFRGQEQKATHVVTVRNEQVNKRYKHAHTQNMFWNRTVFYTESSHSFHSKQQETRNKQETRSKQETRGKQDTYWYLGFTSSCSAIILEVLVFSIASTTTTTSTSTTTTTTITTTTTTSTSTSTSTTTTTTTTPCAMTSYTLYTNGRLYIRNLPHWWKWWDCESWVNGHHFPKVKFIKMFHGEDLASCYCHWSKVSRGQLLTFKEALEGQVLDGQRWDRRTIVHVSVDTFGDAPLPPKPPPVPTAAPVATAPAVPSSSSSSTGTGTTAPTTSTWHSTRKRPLEAAWCYFCRPCQFLLVLGSSFFWPEYAFW